MYSSFSHWHGDCFLPRLTLLLLMFLYCICCGVSTLPGWQSPSMVPAHSLLLPPSCVLVPLDWWDCAEADAVVRGERTP